MMHDCVNTIGADPGIVGFSIPNAPVQSLDLHDNHRLRRYPRRCIRRQGAGDLLQVLKSHSDVKPVENRQFGDAGIGQNAPKARTAIGEGRQRDAIYPTDGVEVPADQYFDVRVGSDDGAENLTSMNLRFDVADPNLQVTFAILATADERGVQGDRDRRRCGFRPESGTWRRTAPARRV
jgi:hypothetical protein